MYKAKYLSECCQYKMVPLQEPFYWLVFCLIIYQIMYTHEHAHIYTKIIQYAHKQAHEQTVLQGFGTYT
jgi:hypothetical protein